MVAPTLEKLAREQAGKVLIAKVNTDEDPEWAMKIWRPGKSQQCFSSPMGKFSSPGWRPT